MNRPLMESSQAEDDALVAVTGGLTWKRRWCIFFEGLRLEIVLFLYTVTFAMRFVVTQQLLLFKTCRYYFDYSESVCKTLDVQNATVEAAVTKMADVYNLLLILAEFVPAALVSVFVSSWCDKHGNRIPIVVSLVGAAVLDVGTVVSVLLPKTPLFVNVLLGLVCGATGGIVCMTAVVQSNASKSTADDMRTVKFLFVMAALLVGIEVGQLVSGQLFKAGGYLPVYCVSAGIVIACSTFVILGNVGAVNRESTWRQMLKDLTVANFGEGYRAALGRRPNGLRHRLTLLAVSLGVILFNGESWYTHLFPCHDETAGCPLRIKCQSKPVQSPAPQHGQTNEQTKNFVMMMQGFSFRSGGSFLAEVLPSMFKSTLGWIRTLMMIMISCHLSGRRTYIAVNPMIRQRV